LPCDFSSAWRDDASDRLLLPITRLRAPASRGFLIASLGCPNAVRGTGVSRRRSRFGGSFAVFDGGRFSPPFRRRRRIEPLTLLSPPHPRSAGAFARTASSGAAKTDCDTPSWKERASSIRSAFPRWMTWSRVSWRRRITAVVTLRTSPVPDLAALPPRSGSRCFFARCRLRRRLVRGCHASTEQPR